MKKFNYDKLIAGWDKYNSRRGEVIPFGEPSDKLVQRAREMANDMLYKTGLGMGLSDMTEVSWYDRLWDIHDDEELFERLKEIVAELIEELGGSKKEKNEIC